MPGPFPGMDPYLEAPAYWRSLHQSLITYATAALNAELPSGYAAYSEERLYVVQPPHPMIPDITVLRRPPERPSQGQGTTAVAERGSQPGILTVYPERIREPFIEIRTGPNPKQVITVIEVLSPSNKAAGSEGRAEYQQKQREILHSHTNLMEIDLLRQGAHTVAVPRAPLLEYGTWDYLICLHRSAHRYTYEYWMNRIQEPLPPIFIPLAEEEPDIILDLQAVFDSAYDAGPYRRDVDYQQDPPTPLNSEDAVWADALLREKGLRT